MAAIMLISTCNYGIVYCTSIIYICTHTCVCIYIYIYIYIYTFRLILTFDELFNFYTVGNLT